MKRWIVIVLGIVVIAGIGFFVVRSYARATSAWAQTLTWPDPELGRLADGVYEGTARLELPAGTAAANSTATVRVTVRDHRYEAIEVIDPPPIRGSMTAFAQIVIEGQSLRPDAISGGTVTKVAVLTAASNAVSGVPIR